jgi:beta-galactosidase
MKRNNILIFCLLVLLSCTSKNAGFKPGKIWRDTTGNPINAHGGGLLFYNGLYYWYGEFKGDSTYRLKWVKTWECWRAEAGGISCYSSSDLQKWTFEGIVLSTSPDTPASDLHPSQVIERPKVIYNEKNRQFVMWMHIDSPDYEKAHAGVAVSSSPTGPFRYLGSFKPNGFDSRDQTLFKDDDGRAYQICSSDWNKSLNINLLNEDYTQTTKFYKKIMVQASREAPALFKRSGKYYLITSGCSGWDPNTAECAVADSIFGEWTNLGNPCVGKDSDKTFYAQSAFVLKVVGEKEQFIALFDRWNKTNLIDSRYIWLPIAFQNGKPQIAWKDQWQIQITAGH